MRTCRASKIKLPRLSKPYLQTELQEEINRLLGDAGWGRLSPAAAAARRGLVGPPRPVGALPRDHPAGIFLGQRAPRVQRRQLAPRQHQFRRGDVVLQLLGRLRADQHAGHGLLRQQPGRGHARRGDAVRLGDRPQRLEHLVQPVVIDRRKSKVAARPCGALLPSTAVGEQPAGQGAPAITRRPDPSALARPRARDARAVVVEGLDGLEPREVAARKCRAPSSAPARPVGAADVAPQPRCTRLSSAPRVSSIGGRGIEGMDLIEVGSRSASAWAAGDGVERMRAREPRSFTPGPMMPIGPVAATASSRAGPVFFSAWPSGWLGRPRGQTSAVSMKLIPARRRLDDLVDRLWPRAPSRTRSPCRRSWAEAGFGERGRPLRRPTACISWKDAPGGGRRGLRRAHAGRNAGRG